LRPKAALRIQCVVGNPMTATPSQGMQWRPHIRRLTREEFARIIAANTVIWGKAVAATKFKAEGGARARR